MIVRVSRKPPVDWFRIMAELKRMGWSRITIGRVLCVPASRVRDWQYGSEPRYDDGRALLMLWRRESLEKLSKNLQRLSVQSGNDSAIASRRPSQAGEANP